MRGYNFKTMFFQTLLLLICYKDNERKHISVVSFTSACAPHFQLSLTNPLLWSQFGRNDIVDGERYDKETERRSQWTTADWLVKHKYAVELHNITTADGYELLLHRIPKPGNQPVLLVHGLLTSSLAWALLGPGKSLAFLLADRNYDVWLANFRGSPYARSYSQLGSKTLDYWSFSFHEMGAYDLPAIMDHIEKATSFHKLILIGHSQALNAFLVLCSVHPEYNERILLMQALAPIVQLHGFVRFKSGDVRRVMRYVKANLKQGSYELLPRGYLSKKCLKIGSDEHKECRTIMKTFAGSWRYSKSIEPLLYGQLLQGASLKEIKHLQQIWNSGDFVAFDYGVEGNRKYYNSVEPYNYNLSLITAPLLLYFGESDAIATPAGVHSIYSRVLNAVAGVYRINAVKFNHFDFLCASDVKTLVNDRVIAMMEQYLDGKLSYVIE
ncbi:lipase 1 [Bactrocera neohumeralis]|uniref:lipase 1 n=1 Tax=Bactrocera neohumeralis TaxID=98809 RepID=UPI0021659AD4|nr:lipase 1 [Bactrocera neohumeralis]